MFTGIVEEKGKVVEVEQREGASRFVLSGRTVIEGTGIGDSIAVNGVCLTVIEIEGDRFAVEAVPETLRRTNLGKLVEGAPVNLERAVGSDRFMGGHYVQGHVDGTGTVVSVDADGEAFDYRFEVPRELMRYIVPKGFIAVDGVSLTVVDVGDDWFTVTLVPHTQDAVVMGGEGAGYTVNIEVDVLGKYVERIVEARLTALEERISRLEDR